MVYFNLVDMGRTISSTELREPTVTTGMENDNEHHDGDTTAEIIVNAAGYRVNEVIGMIGMHRYLG